MGVWGKFNATTKNYQNQMYNEPGVLLAMSAHAALRDFTAALVLSRYMHLALCMLSHLATTTNAAHHLSSDSRLLYGMTYSVLLYIQFSVLIET